MAQIRESVQLHVEHIEAACRAILVKSHAFPSVWAASPFIGLTCGFFISIFLLSQPCQL